MANVFGAPMDANMANYAAQEQTLARRQKLIEALMMQPQHRQEMAGGLVVPMSPVEGLAKVMGAALLGNAQKDADKQASDIATQYQNDVQKRMADALSKYDTLSRGQPAIPGANVPYTDTLGGEAPVGDIQTPGQPAIPGDPRAASMALINSGLPALQGAGLQEVLARNKAETFNLKPGEKRFQGGQVVAENKVDPKVGDVSPKEFTPESVAKFQKTGNYADLVHLQPNDVRDFDAILSFAGIKPGTPEYTKAYSQYVEKKVTHPPATSVSVNTDKSYAGHVAEGLAKQDTALIDAARSAPDRIASARRVREILTKNPITGTGAEARTALTKVFSTAGLIDGQRVATTENLASELAGSTLDAIKTSGLGSGQGFTDKDRQFLERAKSGNIEINSQTLKYLADLNERAGMKSIERGNAVIRKLKSNKNMGDVGTSLDEIPSPAMVMRFDAQGREITE